MTLVGSSYRIDSLLGRGRMGVVYRATDIRTGHTVAIKQLRSEVAQRRPDMVERFRREAEALAQLNHPNIVKAFETLEVGDEHYIVMEIGHEVASLARQRRHGAAPQVVLCGEPDLCRRYAQALALYGFGAAEIAAQATALGLWQIASAAGLVAATPSPRSAP